MKGLLAEADRRANASLFQPQPGPQTTFLTTTADIALYGGAAGSGKTHALLLENLRHVGNSQFGSVIFRRNSTQVTTPGGLWDNAMDLYPLKGAKPKLTPRPTMTFPTGARVSFAHLQYDDDVLSYQGSQIALICYDELTHFTRRQFFYMLSRNRSMCGVKPYVRATTNPDSESWVADFIAWWIDQDTGFPIPARSGVVRFFVVLDDDVKWAGCREDLAQEYGVRPEDAKSVTFVAASIFDNPILLKKDPGYLANLKALGVVEQARLLGGNWKIRPSAGMYFRREQAETVASPPCKVVAVSRAWDLAATPASPQNQSPDATAGVLMGRLQDGRYIVLDVAHGRWGANDVRQKVRGTAAVDKEQYPGTRIRLPQDPGQAGKEQAQSYVTMLAGYAVKTMCVTGDKITRAEPFSSQWQAGKVLLLAGPWNEAYVTELESFPDSRAHDDQVDASSDAFAEVAGGLRPAGATIEATDEDLRPERPVTSMHPAGGWDRGRARDRSDWHDEDRPRMIPRPY